ncbi:MAG: TlpA family protein disulfide reductase [Burkholderiales bacterium]|nr:TlpA family protein disulfide reductase [Burkholderiales bacterium]
MALVLGLGVPLAGGAVEVGAAAPDFEVTGPQGLVKLRQFEGKLLYLDFWASWCGPCRQSFPWMGEMQAKYAAQGLQVLAINLDAKAPDAQKFLAAVPAGFAVAYDPIGASPRMYQIKAMPSSVLIDRKGKVIAVHRGFEPADRARLEEQIQAALKGKP